MNKIKKMNKIKNMTWRLRSMSPSAKSALVFVFASLLTQGLHFITTPIFTRIMSLEEIGLINTYSSYSSVLSIVVGLGLSTGSFSIAMKEYPHEHDRVTSSIYSLTFLSTLVFFVLYLIFHNQLEATIDMPFHFMLLMFAGFLFNPAKTLWISKQRYEFKYRWPFLVTFFSTVLATGLSIAAVLIARQNNFDVSTARLFSSSLVALAFSVAIAVYLIAKGKTTFHKAYWTFALKTSLPMMIHSLSKVILDSSDRIMINSMVGSAAVGIYGTLYSISSVSLIIWTAINGSLVPYIFDKMANRKEKEIKKVASFLLFLYLCVCVLLTLFAPEFVRIMATEEYYEAIYMMPPVAAGIFFTSLYNLYSTVLLYHKKTMFIMASTIVAAGSNISLNYLFIPKYGYIAAAYTTLISFLILTVVQYICMRIVAKEDFYNERLHFAFSAMMIGGMLVCNYLYSHTWLRYVCIAMIVFVCILMRKKIIQILRNMKKRQAPDAQ